MMFHDDLQRIQNLSNLEESIFIIIFLEHAVWNKFYNIYFIIKIQGSIW